jgi:hypothetical protein
MADVTADQVVNEMRLTPKQVLAVRTLQARMLRLDAERETKPRSVNYKERYLQRFVVDAFRELASAEAPRDWMPLELNDFEQRCPSDQVRVFTDLAAVLAQDVTTRAAAVIVLAELVTFSPWDDGTRWNKRARNDGLEAAAADLAGLRDDDLKTMTDEFQSLMKSLRRKSVKWGRVAVASVIGGGVGALTLGWAAPAIGTAIGGTMGLTGAAATSAGLAALGGGSLAAGGFGVAGGTALLTGLGGLVAAGGVGAGTRFSRLASRSIAAEAVKLDLIARMVLADSPDHDEKIRRVVESLQEMIKDLNDRTSLLVNKIAQLKQEKSEAESENRQLKDQIKEMEAELDELKAARTTLAVVRSRLPKVSSA